MPTHAEVAELERVERLPSLLVDATLVQLHAPCPDLRMLGTRSPLEWQLHGHEQCSTCGGSGTLVAMTAPVGYAGWPQAVHVREMTVQLRGARVATAHVRFVDRRLVRGESTHALRAGMTEQFVAWWSTVSRQQLDALEISHDIWERYLGVRDRDWLLLSHVRPLATHLPGR